MPHSTTGRTAHHDVAVGIGFVGVHVSGSAFLEHHDHHQFGTKSRFDYGFD
jgi:hypothetical protein